MLRANSPLGLHDLFYGEIYIKLESTNYSYTNGRGRNSENNTLSQARREKRDWKTKDEMGG
jgi:hypothetical protein